MSSTAMDRQDGSRAPLDGLRILDLSRVVAGPFGTQILSDLGAQVVRIVPPGWTGDGNPAGSGPLTTAEVFDWALNRDKETLSVDLRSPKGHAAMLDLLRDADVLFDNFRPGVMSRLGLGYDQLAQRYPHLITCSMTGFGDVGEWAELPAYDVVVQAASGAMHTTGAERPGEPPCRWGIPIGDIAGGLYAAIGVLAAVIERDHSGVGQAVNVSLFDAQLALSSYRLPQALDAHVDIVTDQRRGGAGTVPYGPFRCGDGSWITVGLAQQHWRKGCAVLGLSEIADDPRFVDEVARGFNQEEVTRVFEERFQTAPAAEWEELLRTAGIPCGRVNSLREAFEHPQVLARSMIKLITDSRGRSCHVAGSPLGIGRSSHRPPGHVVPIEHFSWPSRRVRVVLGEAERPAGNAPPLDGIRVLELDGDEPSKAIAAQILADLGAEVILVERPEPSRAFAVGDEALSPSEALRWGLHRGKKSVVLNLKDASDQDTLRTAIARSSVVIDNYRPGVLERLNLSPTEALKAKPDLVWLSVTGFGQSGPWARSAAYDVNIQALGGAMSITGNGSGGMPLRWGYPIGGLGGALYGAVGVLAALRRAKRDGIGIRLDLSLLDVQIAMQSYRIPQVIDLGLQFGPQPREGGSGARPYGPFATRDGKWFAVAITTPFWKQFCNAIGAADLSTDPRFTTEEARRLHGDALDSIVAKLIAAEDAQTWQERFLRHRLPGSIVRTLEEAVSLPMVRASGMLREIKREDGRLVHVPGFPVRFSRSPTGAWTPAPQRGNDRLFADASAAEPGQVRLS